MNKKKPATRAGFKLLEFNLEFYLSGINALL